MFIRIAAEKHNVLFECTRVVELDDRINFLTGIAGDEMHTELMFDKGENVRVFAMNDQGKTIDSWTINPV